MALRGSNICLCSRPLSSTKEHGLKPDAPGHNNPPLTYKDAGVDIDAGDALVDHIKPLARSTVRSGPSAPARISTATVSNIAGAIWQATVRFQINEYSRN